MKNIELILGPMGSGKSTELVRNFKANLHQRQVYVKFDPSAVNFVSSEIKTHANEVIKTSLTSQGSRLVLSGYFGGKLSDEENLLDFLHFINESRIDILYLDEVQFVHYDSLLSIIENVNADRIMMAGLDLDHNGEWWYNVSNLITELFRFNTTIRFFKATCEFCGKTANMTGRRVKEGGVVAVGGFDLYYACCSKCHKERYEKRD